MKKPTTATKPKQAAKAKVIAVFGARGTGKSGWIKQHQEVRLAKRLIVWDYMHEYQQIARPLNTLGDMLQAIRLKAWRVAYQVDHAKQDAAFDFVCSAARAVGDLAFMQRKAGRVPQTGLTVYDPVLDNMTSTQVMNTTPDATKSAQVYGTFSATETITIETEELLPLGAY